MNHPIEKLVAVMAKLRDPNGGCPWDLEQDFKSIAPYTIEEAYEVADAIDNNDMDNLIQLYRLHLTSATNPSTG